MISRTGTIKELRMQICIFIQKMKLDIAFFFTSPCFFLSLFALDAKPKNDTLLVEIDISFKQATSSAPCRLTWVALHNILGRNNLFLDAWCHEWLVKTQNIFQFVHNTYIGIVRKVLQFFFSHEII